MLYFYLYFFIFKGTFCALISNMYCFVVSLSGSMIFLLYDSIITRTQLRRCKEFLVIWLFLFGRMIFWGRIFRVRVKDGGWIRFVKFSAPRLAVCQGVPLSMRLWLAHQCAESQPSALKRNVIHPRKHTGAIVLGQRTNSHSARDDLTPSHTSPASLYTTTGMYTLAKCARWSRSARCNASDVYEPLTFPISAYHWENSRGSKICRTD